MGIGSYGTDLAEGTHPCALKDGAEVVSWTLTRNMWFHSNKIAILNQLTLLNLYKSAGGGGYGISLKVLFVLITP